MQQQLGQASSRYPRIRVPLNCMHSPLIHAKGLFYSALGRFFMQNPEKADIVGKHNIADIPAAWSVGTPLTLAHTDGSAEALSEGEGVTLGNFTSESENTLGAESPEGEDALQTPVNNRGGRRNAIDEASIIQYNFTAALAMSFVIQDKIVAAEITLHPSQRASGSSNLRSCLYLQIGS